MRGFNCFRKSERKSLTFPFFCWVRNPKTGKKQKKYPLFFSTKTPQIFFQRYTVFSWPTWVSEISFSACRTAQKLTGPQVFTSLRSSCPKYLMNPSGITQSAITFPTGLWVVLKLPLPLNSVKSRPLSFLMPIICGSILSLTFIHCVNGVKRVWLLSSRVNILTQTRWILLKLARVQ